MPTNIKIEHHLMLLMLTDLVYLEISIDTSSVVAEIRLPSRSWRVQRVTDMKIEG